MICPSRQPGMIQESEGKGPWICPMSRCRHELDIDLAWDATGCRLIGGKLLAPIRAYIINDLPYIDLEQFDGICTALVASHRQGRRHVSESTPGHYVNRGFNTMHARSGRDRCYLKSNSAPPSSSSRRRK